MAVLKIKDENGNFIDIPAIIGPKGESTIAVYDTEEQLIGTWFGKNLYRRVVIFPRGTDGATTEQQYYLGWGSDVDMIYIANGSYFTYQNKRRIPFPYYQSQDASTPGDAYAWIGHYDGWGLGLNYCLTNEDMAYGEFAIVLEYTKKSENNLISFTVGDWRFTAEQGMTWQEWCDSEYNIHNYYVGDYGVSIEGPQWGLVVRENDWYNYVMGDDVINNEEVYECNQEPV